jgi:putative redox protein
MNIHSKTESVGAFAQIIDVRSHKLHADVSNELGGTDSAPSPHDYFDAALAACKTLTAHWYAKRHGLALERVEVDVQRDSSQERQGKYTLKVKLSYHGALSHEDKKRVHAAVERCPVHKLMTTVDVSIETAPLEDA